MLEQRQLFKELVDRTLMILVSRCSECGAIVARIEYPETAKLDSSCDQHDHYKETGHSSYEALKHLVVYMNQADKDLANQLGEAQRKAFDEFRKSRVDKGSEGT
jgi:hypothetical protein